MAKNKFIGKWRITEMSNWDKDYFDMEVPAYIEINKNLMGNFQFGLVSGQIDGRITKYKGVELFEFTWDGNDECDSASGSGEIALIDESNAEGTIQIHLGDSSAFKAKRMKK
jgi:hypothetical protein